MKRYITSWPADANGQTHWEGLLLETSPSKAFVRVLWGYKADGTADQEWVPAEEFAKSIVEEVPLVGQILPVPAPTSMPGRPIRQVNAPWMQPQPF